MLYSALFYGCKSVVLTLIQKKLKLINLLLQNVQVCIKPEQLNLGKAV